MRVKTYSSSEHPRSSLNFKQLRVTVYVVSKAESRVFVARERILRPRRSRGLKNVQVVRKNPFGSGASTIFHHTK